MKPNNHYKQYESPAMEIIVVCTNSIIAESYVEKPGQWMPEPSDNSIPFFPGINL